MSRSKEYRAVKNYIHNELKLSKEDIREIILPLVKQEAMRIFRNTYGDDVNIENFIRCMVTDEIKKHDFSIIRNLTKEVIMEKVLGDLKIEIKTKE